MSISQSKLFSDLIFFFCRLLTLKAAHLMDTVGNKVCITLLTHNFQAEINHTFFLTWFSPHVVGRCSRDRHD